MGFNIIMTISLFPLLLIMYFVFRFEGSYKKGFLFGIRLDEKYIHNNEITAIQKKYKKTLNIILLISILISFSSYFSIHMSIQYTIWMIWLIFVIFIFIFPFIIANHKVNAWIKLNNIQFEYSNDNYYDDKYWILGMFYYNPNNKKITIKKRFGFGTTINMATSIGKVLIIFLILTFLMIPASCILLISEEFIPISLSIENNKLTAHHIINNYNISLDNIDDLTLIDELPKLTKVSGTSMDNIKRGTFDVYHQGKCKVFLNPQNHYFIRFKVNEIYYYFSSENDILTQDIYKELLTYLQ